MHTRDERIHPMCSIYRDKADTRAPVKLPSIRPLICQQNANFVTAVYCCTFLYPEPISNRRHVPVAGVTVLEKSRTTASSNRGTRRHLGRIESRSEPGLHTRAAMKTHSPAVQAYAAQGLTEVHALVQQRVEKCACVGGEGGWALKTMTITKSFNETCLR